MTYRGTTPASDCANLGNAQVFDWDLKDRLGRSNADGVFPREKLSYTPFGDSRIFERQDNVGGTTLYSYLTDQSHEIATCAVNGSKMEFVLYGPGMDNLFSRHDFTAA